MATRKTETTRTTRAAKKTTGRQAAKATAKKAAARKQPATTRTSRRAAAAPEPAKRGRGRPRKDEAVAAPKRGPGRPRKDETTVAAKRTPRKPADKTVSRPRPNKAQEEQPTRRRRASPTKEAPAAPRMRRSAITDPKTHPWYQGVLRADFDGMTKGDRVFAQREVRPMFAGLVNVWRLLGTIDGASARLRVSEHQGGSHLKNLVKWQTVLDEGAEKPRVRSSRDNPAAHAKLDHAFAKLDAQE